MQFFFTNYYMQVDECIFIICDKVYFLYQKYIFCWDTDNLRIDLKKIWIKLFLKFN